MRENALSHKPSPQHPGPELQETLKTEQETAIIRFAFGEGYSGQECQEGPRGEESETCLEAGIDSHKREVVQATRKRKGPQASPAAQKVQGFPLWGGNPQHHQGLRWSAMPGDSGAKPDPHSQGALCFTPVYMFTYSLPRASFPRA